MIRGFSIHSFVIGVMFGVLLSGAWFLRDVADWSTLSSPHLLTTEKRELSAPESSSVSVTRQVSGDMVIVESVTVPPPGVWVAVREINGNDLGKVLGAARVSGPHSNVTVPLLRATEPSSQYAIQLYRDDNNNSFDPLVNSVYVDFDTGKRVVVYFTTTE